MLQRVYDIQLLLYSNVIHIDSVKLFLQATNKSIYMYIHFINPFQNIFSSKDDNYISLSLTENKISTNIYKWGGGAILLVLSLYLVDFIERKTLFNSRYTIIDQYYKAVQTRIMLARLYKLYYINLFYSFEGILSYLLFFYSFLGAQDTRLFFKLPSIFIICFFAINYAYKIIFSRKIVSLVLLSLVFLLAYLVIQFACLFIQKYDNKSSILMIQQKLYRQAVDISRTEFKQKQENYILKVQLQPNNEFKTSKLSTNLQNKLEAFSYQRVKINSQQQLD
ncbi:hypothetical protein ABPG72_006920 [Tetrahymena utriculariae]